MKIHDGDKEITVNCEVEKPRCRICKLKYKTPAALQYHNVMTHPEMTSSTLSSSPTPNSSALSPSRTKVRVKSMTKSVDLVQDIIKQELPKSNIKSEESSSFKRLQSLPWLDLSMKPLEEMNSIVAKTTDKLDKGVHVNGFIKSDVNLKLVQSSSAFDIQKIKAEKESQQLVEKSSTINYDIIKNVLEKCSSRKCKVSTNVMKSLTSSALSHNKKIVESAMQKSLTSSSSQSWINGKRKIVKPKRFLQEELSVNQNGIAEAQEPVKELSIKVRKPLRKSVWPQRKFTVIEEDTDLTPHRRKSERTYDGDKLFGCNHCPLAFSSKDARVEHERTHQEKPYECPYCEMRFLAELSMNRHMRIHK